MKIAFVSTILDYPWGGADAMWTAAAEAASARRDTLLLAISHKTAANSRLQTLIGRGARWVAREKATYSLRARAQCYANRALARADSLVRQLDAFAPHRIVISNGGTYDIAIEGPLRRWLTESRTPYHLIANWQRENPELSPAERDVVVPAFELAQGITFLSDRNLQVTRRHLLRSLPNACWRHTPLSERGGTVLPWPADETLRFATVARLEPVKGLDLLLHAAKSALPSDGRWELNLYGAGPDDAYLRELVRYLGLEGRVHLRGHCDLRTVWMNNHMLLSPALEEGGPMTLPEAMLRGRPVAATDIGGTDYWIEDGTTGFIAPAPRVPQLIEMLRRCWEGRINLREMGAQSASRAHRLFRPDDYMGIIEP